MIAPVECLNHERALRVGTLNGAHMVHVDLANRLKVDAATQLCLALIQVIAQRTLLSVEDKPALVPRLELLAHL